MINKETYLIIAPHRQLHQIPWATLPFGATNEPLVTQSVLSIVPSLLSLSTLWQRESKIGESPSHFLLIQVSDFQDRHDPLPGTFNELNGLKSMLMGNVDSLSESDATVARLKGLGEAGELGRYAAMHIASHAFIDEVTGRLSGISLYDDELWLDELSQLAPIPRLVTVSACNGLRTIVHEGDEQTGVSIALLVGGAQTVIGSLWPLLDREASGFMHDFYHHLLEQPNHPAVALALTQRMAYQSKAKIQTWAGFQLVGVPTSALHLRSG